MKTLILYCHPNPASFNHAILTTVIESLEKGGHLYRVRDLYQLNFQPVLDPTDFEAIGQGQVLPDVAEEQEHIRWADRIIAIHPIWWTGLPARMKGYIDRVFSFGFAYRIDASGLTGLLSDKEALIITTTGAPSEYYQQVGMHDALKKTIDEGIYQFCAITVLDHIFYGAVPTVDDQIRKQYLAALQQRIYDLY